LSGVRITPRPGKAVPVDIPVVATSEIEGTTRTARGGAAQGVGGVTVELLDATGALVQRTMTAYDGFYLLTHVRRGAYRVRVAHESLNLKVAAGAAPLEKVVTVTGARPVISGIDFDLPQTSAPEPGATTRIAQTPAAPASSAPSAPSVPIAPSAPGTPADDAGHVVQLGTFSIAANAERLVVAVRDIAPDARTTAVGAYTAVRTAPRPAAEAVTLVQELRRRGIEAIILRTREGRGMAAPNDGFVIQLGAFRNPQNAASLVRQVRARTGEWKVSIERRGSLYFVRTASVATREAAAAARDALRRLGFEAVVERATGP
jgi:cell division septation protein DedD